MSSKSLNRMIHDENRQMKRDEARDRAQRITRRSIQQLHDGIEEVVVARFDVHEVADCETITFEEMSPVEQFDVVALESGHYDDYSQSDLAIEALRAKLLGEGDDEDRMAPWEVMVRTGMDEDEAALVAWSSEEFDAQREWERIAKKERFYASLEAEEGDDDEGYPETDVWPPVATFDDVLDAMGYETGMRGFSITTRP